MNVKLEAIRLHLEQVWDKTPGKVDWLGLEKTIRDILFVVNEARTGYKPPPYSEALNLINEAITAYTGRGYA